MTAAKRRAWKALIVSAPVSAGGQDFEIGKLGFPQVATLAAEDAIVGDAVQKLFTSSGAGNIAERLQKAVEAVATESGVERATVARHVLAYLPRFLVKLISASVIVADEEERADFQAWFERQSFGDTLAVLVPWIDLNVAREYADPLLEVLAHLGVWAQDFPTQVRAALKSKPSEPEPAPVPQPETQAPPAETAQAA